MKEVKLNSVRVNSNTQAHEDANARMQRKDSDNPNPLSKQKSLKFLFPSGEPESGRFSRSEARNSFQLDPGQVVLGFFAPLGGVVLPTS